MHRGHDHDHHHHHGNGAAGAGHNHAPALKSTAQWQTPHKPEQADRYHRSDMVEPAERMAKSSREPTAVADVRDRGLAASMNRAMIGTDLH